MGESTTECHVLRSAMGNACSVRIPHQFPVTPTRPVGGVGEWDQQSESAVPLLAIKLVAQRDLSDAPRDPIAHHWWLLTQRD